MNKKKIIIWSLLGLVVIGVAFWAFTAATSYDRSRKAEVTEAKSAAARELEDLKSQLQAQLAEAKAAADAAAKAKTEAEAAAAEKRNRMPNASESPKERRRRSPTPRKVS